MPRPPTPHPDFPPGTVVRVRPMGSVANPQRRRLAGHVGRVVSSTRADVLVEFPGEEFRVHFQPQHLERPTDHPGPAGAAAGEPPGA